jgi:hypothetical protein
VNRCGVFIEDKLDIKGAIELVCAIKGFLIGFGIYLKI